MATYKNAKELGGKILEYGDILLFHWKEGRKKLAYKVAEDHLANTAEDSNIAVLEKLGLLAHESRLGFCSEAYGYTPREGAFPSCKYRDYPALTRVAIKIFIELEKRKEKNMPETYKYSADLVGKVLKKNDRVVFTFGDREFLYRVVTDHLSCRARGVTNSIIFDKLGFMPGEKERFCSELYGYPAKEGAFPAVKAGDYVALTKVAVALLEKIEKSVPTKIKKEVMPEYKTEVEKSVIILQTEENKDRVITWENLQEGDFLKDKRDDSWYAGDDSWYAKVLAVCGSVFLLSSEDKDITAPSTEFQRANKWYTVWELQEFYELVQPKPLEKVAELTLEEIEELLGSKVRIVEK